MLKSTCFLKLLTGGYYCEEAGKTQPTAPCDAGFFCKQYAETAIPNQGADQADVCPQGMNMLQLDLLNVAAKRKWEMFGGWEKI